MLAPCCLCAKQTSDCCCDIEMPQKLLDNYIKTETRMFASVHMLVSLHPTVVLLALYNEVKKYIFKFVRVSLRALDEFSSNNVDLTPALWLSSLQLESHFPFTFVQL